jgi:hypothetical protein
MMNLPPDTSNSLLLSAGLSRSIRKIGLIFGIGLLSGLTTILWFLIAVHSSSRHELLLAIFCGGCLSEPPQKIFFIILFVIYVNKYF